MRGRVREYVLGLVAGLERENGWTLAEQAGEVSPVGMQRLLRRADWDIAGVCDDVRFAVNFTVVRIKDKGLVRKSAKTPPVDCSLRPIPSPRLRMMLVSVDRNSPTLTR